MTIIETLIIESTIGCLLRVLLLIPPPCILILVLVVRVLCVVLTTLLRPSFRRCSLDSCWRRLPGIVTVLNLEASQPLEGVRLVV